MPIILATQKAEIGNIMAVGQPKQKVCETPHLNRKEVGVCTPMIPATAGSIKQKDHGPGQPGHKTTPCLQNNQSKKGLEVWLKGYSACLASSKPCIQTPILPENK
jgi:hypothetical protein